MITCNRILLPFLALLVFGRPAGRADPGGLDARSPFLPSSDPAAATAAAAEAYQLAGASISGNGGQICLYEAATKRCRWIRLGATEGSVEAVSYDPARDQAVIRIGGREQTLTLRPAVVAAGGAAAPGGSGAAGPGRSAAAVAAEQRNARMLLSDLLQIGAKQRQTYAEARKKALGQPGP